VADETSKRGGYLALIGLFKKNEPKPDREPTLRDKDQILAYIEELYRVRTEIATKASEDSDISYMVKVETVNEEKGSFTISMQNRPPREPEPGTIIFFYFTMDGLRFRTQARFLARGGYMQSEFALPEAILHAERRGNVRVRFTPREPAKAVVLEGLFEGLGISGPIINLSMGGFNMRVDRVIDIRKDRRIQARTDLFHSVSKLALIRLSDLPHTPMVECSGVLRHVSSRSEGFFLGIELESMGSFETQAMTQVIARKVPGFGVGFPRKRRRGEIEANPEELLEPEADEIQPPTEAEEALEDSEIQDLREIVQSPNRVALLRRRSRHILLLASDELERAVLLGTLYADGYRNIHEAAGLVQAMNLTHRYPLDALIVDQQVGRLSALDMIQNLRNGGRLATAKVIVLKANDDVKLKVAEKAGGIDLTVTHPVDFDGVLKPELERLLGIN
jgi:CheY-like chemotaxis protein